MRPQLALSLPLTLLILAAASCKKLERRWISSPLLASGDRWINIEDDIKRRTDSIRKWVEDGHRTSIHNMQTHFSTMFDREPTAESSDFDPSVVVVDKGDAEHESNGQFNEPAFAFSLDFPQINFDRSKFWSSFPSGMFSRQQPWWKGPNVCIERRVIEGKDAANSTKSEALDTEDNFDFRGQHSLNRLFSFQSTHCSESDTSYTCVSKVLRGRENKITIVKHQCCHGFKRMSNKFCTQVDLKGLVQTMKDLKSNRMLRLIERIGLSKNLGSDNLTVFAVTDDSLIEFEDDNTRVENEIETETTAGLTPLTARKRRQLDNQVSEVMAMHLIPGIIRTGDFVDNQLIETLSPSRKIRINIFNEYSPKRVVTANCAPIVSANNHATNGMVHILDRVMPIANQSVADIIDKNPRFSILKNMLLKTGLIGKLSDESQSLTLLAPTNDAFLRLDQLYLERLLNGQSCVEPLLMNHVIDSTLCLSAIKDLGSVKNSIDVFLPIKRVDNKLEIDGIKVVESDILGTNGVVHVIDGVMISERSQPISQYLEKNRMTQYLDLIKESGLLQNWDGLQSVSFFIPTIDAIKGLTDNRLQQIRNNSKEALEYHVVSPQTRLLAVNSDLMLNAIDRNQIRVNTFGDFAGFGFRPTVTAQCGKIVAQNQVCGANIHLVDRFIAPAKGNLTQVLQSKDRFSLLTKIIDISGIANEISEGVYTLLAPTDQTLTNDLTEKEIETLLKNQSEAEKFIRSYILPEILCCSGVDTSALIFSSQQIRAIDGSLLSVHKSFNGRVRFGNARVTECDVMATNGVIHVLNRVLESKPNLSSSLGFPFEIVL